MKRKHKVLAAAAAGLMLGFCHDSALAVVVSASDNNPEVVDFSTIMRTVSIGTAGPILDVTVTLDFSKCSRNTTETDECPLSVGTPFHNEIFFSLESPDGTVVDLIPFDTWPSGDTDFDGEILLDDAAPALVNAVPNDENPAAGTFQPINALSGFDGGPANGDWILTVEDDARNDPLLYRGFTLNVDVGVPVPEPTTLLLLGLGLAGLGFARRRL